MELIIFYIQVFYITDPADKKWHVVLSDKRRIVGVANVVDEEDFDHFDEIPPFSSGVENIPVDEVPVVRTDHDEGIWIERHKRKKKKN